MSVEIQNLQGLFSTAGRAARLGIDSGLYSCFYFYFILIKIPNMHKSRG